MIHPTPGRIVWYAPNARDLHGSSEPPMVQLSGLPLAAMVVGIHTERCVNLDVVDSTGRHFARPYVQLLQNDGQDVPVGEGPFAQWMPYQKGKVGEAWKETDKTVLAADHPVQQLADAVGGTIEHVEILPDGSGGAMMSMPLPKNHWLTQPGYNVPPMPFRKGTDDPERQAWAEKIRAAGRYAVRCATMNGAEDDFDPDALVQNLVVGMIGYFTPTGLSSDADANPPQ